MPGIKQSASVLEHSVLSVVLAGTPVNLTPESVLHWKILMEVAENKTVTLDLVPGGSDGLTGILCIDCLDTENLVTASERGGLKDAVRDQDSDRVAFTPKTIVSAKAIINLLVSGGRDKYHYDETGSGCRFWCSTVVGDLERKGILEKGSEVEFEEHVVACNKKNPDRYPVPTRKGTFYWT